jgi:hypothetical protein
MSAQLQRVRAHDAEDVPVAQALLDRAALGGQIPAAIATDPRPGPAMFPERLAEPRQDQLHARARSPEDDRLAASSQERQGPALGEGERGTACARRRIDDRGVHEQDVPLARRRAVPVHDERCPAREAGSQLTRVRDRGRAGDDHGV